MEYQCFETQNPILKIQILLVDDDATTLSIVSSMLRISSRQETMLQLSVVTVKSPLEALSTLRVNQGSFDLIVSDLHMPDMNGFQLQKQVSEEFKLPVMIMSSDDKEQVMLECLQSGAVLYVLKPLSQDDVRNIWQYAVAAKKGRNTLNIEETNSMNLLGVSPSSSSELQILNSDGIGAEINSGTPMNEDGNEVENNNNEVPKGKKSGKKRDRDDRGGDCEDDEDAPTATKKVKVVWTNSLHNRFLQAINHIGLEKAVPKKILEVMAVPGLTRENVASHLQKYRLFLKRVAEKGDYTMRTFSERSLRSNFPAGPSFDFQDYRSNYPQFTPPLQPFHPGIGGNGSANSNHALSSFPRQEPPRTNSELTQYSFGQACFPGNSTGFQQLLLGNSDTINQQAERPGFQPNVPGTNLFPQGNMPYGLMNGTSNGMGNNNARAMEVHQQPFQERSSISRFDSNGIGSNSTGFAFGNLGAMNNTSNLAMNANNGHTGMRMAGNGLAAGMEQMQIDGNQRPNGFNSFNNPSGFGFVNSNFNNNVAPTGAFGDYSSPRFGSTGFGNGNQMPQTFNGFNQSNALILPSHQQQQQFGLENGPGQQNHQQIGGVTESLFNSYNILQQGMASRVQNAHVHNSEVNPSMGQLINTSIPGSSNCNFQLNNHGQLHGGEQALNPDFISNKDSDNNYHPIFEDQSIEGIIDSEIADIFPVENGPLEKWGNDFVDTLLDYGYAV